MANKKDFKEIYTKSSKLKMAADRLRFYPVVFVCCLVVAFGSHVRKLTSDDLRNVGQSTKKDFIAVFFDKLGK